MIAGAALTCGIVPAPALAEQAALEEIIVTATKREQSLQDVPLAISAVEGEDLATMVIKRFDDIEMPAVHIGQGGFNDALFIRGVGSGFGTGFEQSAPLYLDGTWFGTAQSQRLALLDVGRIEILKGPQPTYLGKNAVAGAVAVVSARPTDEFAAGIDASYEFEAEESAFSGYLSGPLGGGLKARVALKTSDMKGYMKNLGTGEDNPAKKDTAGRLSLMWNPTESIEVFGKYEYLKYDEGSRATQVLKCLPAAPRDPTVEDCVFDLTRAVSFDRAAWDPPANPFFTYRHGGPEYQELELNNGLLQLSWDTGPATLVANASYYQQDNASFAKGDHNVLQRVAAEAISVTRLFSQEVRLTSNGGGRFSWMAGVYHDEQQQDGDTLQILVTMAMGNESGYEQDAKTWSAFAEVGIGLTDTVTARLGGRYSEIKKTADLYWNLWRVTPLVKVPLGPAYPFLPITLKTDDSSTDPAVSLEWRPNNESLWYVSYREGFKAGGIDLDLSSGVIDDLLFEPESVDYYEAGGKLMLVDGRLRLNMAAFRGDYNNLQVTQLDAETGNFRVLNAAEARSQGVELDAAFAVGAGVTLNAAITFLDSKYRSFPGAQCWQNPAQTAAQGCVQIGTVGGVPVFGQDLAGARTSFAPEFSGTLGVDFRHETGWNWFGDGVSLLARAQVFYTDDFNTNFDADPLTVQGSYYKFDARLGLAGTSGSWEVAVIGRNLNNEITSHWIANTPGNGQSKFAQTDRPRELALQFRLNF